MFLQCSLLRLSTRGNVNVISELLPLPLLKKNERSFVTWAENARPPPCISAGRFSAWAGSFSAQATKNCINQSGLLFRCALYSVEINGALFVFAFLMDSLIE